MKIKDLIFQIKKITFNEALEYLVKTAQERRKKVFVVTLNTEIVMLARSDLRYEKILKSADLALNDSIGIVWARKMFGKPSKGRIHGVDLVEGLAKAVAKKPIRIGFLGGRENVAQRTAERLKSRYPGLKVAFAISEYSDVTQKVGKISKSDDRIIRDSETPDLRNTDSPSFLSFPKTDILFVAFGSPKQEKWISENLSKIDVKVAIGVGGAFDFISGKVKRAPVWIRNLGLEWLFRLFIQPWRIKRQTKLAEFVLLVIKERIFG